MPCMTSDTVGRCNNHINVIAIDKEESNQLEYQALAFYKFVQIPSINEVQRLRNEVEAYLLELSATGSIILASEGINGTVCLPVHHVSTFLHYLNSHEYFGDDEIGLIEKNLNYSYYTENKGEMTLRTRLSPPGKRNCFPRLKVKKAEIVTMGLRCDPKKSGIYLSPRQWNDVLRDPDVLVIDTRNSYEINVGTFEHAVTPNIDSFRDFPIWLEELVLGKEFNKEDCVSTAVSKDNGSSANRRLKSIAMFCTGGIRCEKATTFAKSLDKFASVYHLEGGILAYLDQIPFEDSLWKGECFVFDKPFAVGHGLKQTGLYSSCFACRRLLSGADMKREDFHEGMTCRYCICNTTDEQKSAFAHRQNMVLLAQAMGVDHIYDPKVKNHVATRKATG